jgi:peptidoglycan-N-acetylglucosamine deacetylase
MAAGPRALKGQTSRHALLLLGAGFGALCGALSPSGPGASAAPRVSCQNPATSLGVSRVLEIDTTGGPRFGHQQYQDQNFLAPGEVVLTFDDGPLRPYTQPIVDALEAQCTKATFFMVGSQAIADPDMVRQIIRKGHTVGTHTWSHANLRKSTPLKARQEIELGFSAVAAAAGQPISPFFRFPFLADTKAMMGYAQTRNMGVWSIEVDSLDYKSKSAAAVHQEILSQLAAQGKGIILFHDIQPATAQALPALLEALKAKGYKVVHLKPKTMVTTLPEFDALARDANARKQVAAATQPLAPRAVTWGSASPSIANPRVAGAPQVAPSQGWATAPSAQAPRTASAANPSAVFTGNGSGYPAARTPGSVPAPIPQGAAPSGGAALPPGSGVPAAGVGDPAQAPFPRVARQRSPQSEDWRDKIFSR